MSEHQATVDRYLVKRTGKPSQRALNAGYYVITEAQAKKLCGGSLPRSGYSKHFELDGKPSIRTSTDAYGVQQTPDGGGYVWAITIKEAAFGLEWHATGPWLERFVGDWVQNGTWTLSGAALTA
jgi:hypothetical protein